METCQKASQKLKFHLGCYNPSVVPAQGLPLPPEGVLHVFGESLLHVVWPAPKLTCALQEVGY